KLPVEPLGCTHVYQSYVCFLRDDTGITVEQIGKKRDLFLKHLADAGIASVQGAQSMACINFYQRKYHWKPQDFPIAQIVDAATVALPIYPGLTPEEQGYVIQCIRSFQG